jgi:hypothetical protein
VGRESGTGINLISKKGKNSSHLSTHYFESIRKQIAQQLDEVVKKVIIEVILSNRP